MKKSIRSLLSLLLCALLISSFPLSIFAQNTSKEDFILPVTPSESEEILEEAPIEDVETETQGQFVNDQTEEENLEVSVNQPAEDEIANLEESEVNPDLIQELSEEENLDAPVKQPVEAEIPESEETALETESETEENVEIPEVMQPKDGNVIQAVAEPNGITIHTKEYPIGWRKQSSWFNPENKNYDIEVPVTTEEMYFSIQKKPGQNFTATLDGNEWFILVNPDDPSNPYTESVVFEKRIQNVRDFTITCHEGANQTTYTFKVTRPAQTSSHITVEGGTSFPTDAWMSDPVQITADAPPAGKIFDRWTTNDQHVIFADAHAPVTTFDMPPGNVTVKANFKDDPAPISAELQSLKVHVNHHETGWEEIDPDPLFDAKVFDYTIQSSWKHDALYLSFVKQFAGQTVSATFQGSTLDIDGNQTSRIYMDPGESGELILKVTSANGTVNQEYIFVCKRAITPTFPVTVVGGVAAKEEYEVGELVEITPDVFQTFEKWTSLDGVIFADENAPKTSFTMPEKPVQVEANYKVDPGYNPDTDATLHLLSCEVYHPSSGFEESVLNPAFHPDTNHYRLDLDGKYQSVYFSFNKNVEGQQVHVTVDGGDIDYQNNGGTYHVDNYSLMPGEKAQFHFSVTSKDGSVTQTYQVDVTRGVPTAYTITVVDGHADKATAYEGELVNIFADSPRLFEKWSSEDGIVFSDENSVVANFRMPAKNVTIKAHQKDDPGYDPETDAQLMKISSSGIKGDVVEDVAMNPVFDATTMNYQVNMAGEYSRIILSLYKNHKDQKISMSLDGSEIEYEYYHDTYVSTGSHYVKPGETRNFVFQVTSKDGSVTNQYTVAVTREVVPVFPITVIGGTAERTEAAAGEHVWIQADVMAFFEQWESPQLIKFNVKTNPTTYFTMPNQAVTITAKNNMPIAYDPDRDSTLRDMYPVIFKANQHYGSSSNPRPKYDPSIAEYQYTLGGKYHSIALTLSPNVKGQKITVTANGYTLASKENHWLDVETESMYIAPGNSLLFEIRVTSKDGTSESLYTLKVDRSTSGTYPVTVEGGSGDKSRAAMGEIVTIVADDAARFQSWTSENGVVFEDENSHTTTFTMPDQAVKVTAQLRAYKIIKGDQTQWKKGSNKNVQLVSDAPFAKFDSVLVDDKLLNAADYEVKDGSTEVTLKIDYLETLTLGDHEVKIMATDGLAIASITIVKADDKDDPSDDKKTPGDKNPGGSKDPSSEKRGLLPRTGSDKGIPYWPLLFIFLGALLFKNKKTRSSH